MIKRCKTCNVELTAYVNWPLSWEKEDRLQCKGCAKTYTNNSVINSNRMYVDGKYIPRSHPLYKAGRYTSFNDAAFSSFENVQRSKGGYVYAISNPAWEGWIKIGMAMDASDRCNSYQTSSPLRDYKLEVAVPVEDRRKAETMAHKKANELAEDRQAEWFKLPLHSAINIVRSMENETNT